MSGYTPGPWRIVGADGYALAIWGPEAQDVVSENRGPMRQEDARLIAAAPELADALEERFSTCGCLDEAADTHEMGFSGPAFFEQYACSACKRDRELLKRVGRR